MRHLGRLKGSTLELELFPTVIGRYSRKSRHSRIKESDNGVNQEPQIVNQTSKVLVFMVGCCVWLVTS